MTCSRSGIDCLAVSIANCGGLGRLTSAPGSVASFAAFLVVMVHPIPWYFIAAMTIIGGWAIFRSAESENKDACRGDVVIDDVVGYFVSSLFLERSYLFPALVLFRIIDILQPPPICWMVKFPGALGIMSRGIFAGIITNLLIAGFDYLVYGVMYGGGSGV